MRDERAASLKRVIEHIGLLTRDFAAHRTYPFQSRQLGRTAMDLLFTLSRTDGLSVAAIADRLAVTSGAVSQTIDPLRDDGLVTSEVNQADRRGRVIRLTELARAEVRTFEDSYFQAIAPRFDRLSYDDIVELDRILSAIGDPA